MKDQPMPKVPNRWFDSEDVKPYLTLEERLTIAIETLEAYRNISCEAKDSTTQFSRAAAALELIKG